MVDKYWPRDIAEVDERPSLINEPLSAPDGTTALPVCYRERPLHAVLCESLKQTRELLNRLELRGVQVARAEQREVVRLLYVATRHQVKALAAVLESRGWNDQGRPGSFFTLSEIMFVSCITCWLRSACCAMSR